MHQAATILERFPGPLTLTVSLRTKLTGLALCVVFAALFAWLLFADNPAARGYLSGSYGTIVAWVSFVVSGALALRQLILLLVPSAASLMLDDDGFETRHIFHRNRFRWRNVSDFRVETTVWRGRIGGPIPRITYEARRAGRDDSTRATRILPEIYGLPQDEFAALMNEWRKRALAQKVVRMR